MSHFVRPMLSSLLIATALAACGGSISANRAGDSSAVVSNAPVRR